MNKGVFILIFGMFGAFSAQAQYYPGYGPDSTAKQQANRNSNNNIPHRWFAGGSLALEFGSYTDIDVAPEIGYRVSNWFAFGPVFNINFISDQTYPGVVDNYTILGAGIFGRVYPIRHLFLQVEPQFNNSTEQFKENGVGDASTSYGAMSLLLGGGYVEQIGQGSEFTFGLLYDVLQNPNSPYFGTPVLQGGFDIGF